MPLKNVSSEVIVKMTPKARSDEMVTTFLMKLNVATTCMGIILGAQDIWCEEIVYLQEQHKFLYNPLRMYLQTTTLQLE